MSHSQKPHMPSLPTNIQSTTAVEVAQKLDQILYALMPLHNLLQEQEEADQTLKSQLTEIMDGLGLAANSLQTSAVAMNQIAEVDRLTPAQQSAFTHLNGRLDHMEESLKTLSRWLGAPIDAHVELTSSATS